VWSEDRTPKGIGDSSSKIPLPPILLLWSEDRTPKGIGDLSPDFLVSFPPVSRGQKTERRKALVTVCRWRDCAVRLAGGQKTERRKALVTNPLNTFSYFFLSRGQKTERRKALVTNCDISSFKLFF
jgi:hypothetical protein